MEKIQQLLIVMKESLDGVVRQEKQHKKAGYTASASCGRVGRGGNARFQTF